MSTLEYFHHERIDLGKNETSKKIQPAHGISSDIRYAQLLISTPMQWCQNVISERRTFYARYRHIKKSRLSDIVSPEEGSETHVNVIAVIAEAGFGRHLMSVPAFFVWGA
jgi:hypothetical protein